LRLLAQRDAVDCAPFRAVAAALAAAQRRSDELDNRDSELASARVESEQLRGEVTRLQDACGQAGLRLRAASEVVKAQAARLSSATADIIGLRSELAESRALTATLGAEVRCPSMNAECDPPVHRSADAAVFSWLRSDEQSKSRVMSWPSASRCVATCGVEARFSPRIDRRTRRRPRIDSRAYAWSVRTCGGASSAKMSQGRRRRPRQQSQGWMAASAASQPFLLRHPRRCRRRRRSPSSCRLRRDTRCAAARRGRRTQSPGELPESSSPPLARTGASRRVMRCMSPILLSSHARGAADMGQRERAARLPCLRGRRFAAGSRLAAVGAGGARCSHAAAAQRRGRPSCHTVGPAQRTSPLHPSRSHLARRRRGRGRHAWPRLHSRCRRVEHMHA